MGKNYPFLEGFSFALANFRKNDLLYWSFWLTIVNIAGAVAEKLFAQNFWAYGISNLGNPNMDIALLLKSFAIAMAALLVSLYISARAMVSAMKISKVKAAKAMDFARWVWLQIYKVVLNAVCYYDWKLLVPSIALAALAALSYFAIPLAAFPLFFMAVLAWEAAFLIHATRTGFAVYMFLEGEENAGKVVRKSDRMVKGKTAEVFAAQMLAMLALLLPLLAIGFLTGEAVGGIGAGQYAMAGVEILVVMVISVLTLALQQAISAHIYAFFKKGRAAMAKQGNRKLRQGNHKLI